MCRLTSPFSRSAVEQGDTSRAGLSRAQQGSPAEKDARTSQQGGAVGARRDASSESCTPVGDPGGAQLPRRHSAHSAGDLGSYPVIICHVMACGPLCSAFDAVFLPRECQSAPGFLELSLARLLARTRSMWCRWTSLDFAGLGPPNSGNSGIILRSFRQDRDCSTAIWKQGHGPTLTPLNGLLCYPGGASWRSTAIISVRRTQAVKTAGTTIQRTGNKGVAAAFVAWEVPTTS